MQKLFVSQPMNGKTKDEILSVREHLIEVAERIMEKKFDVIDSLILDAPDDANALWYLGESLKRMSNADFVIFARNWEKYRGCRLEHQAAQTYSLGMIYETVWEE